MMLSTYSISSAKNVFLLKIFSVENAFQKNEFVFQYLVATRTIII